MALPPASEPPAADAMADPTPLRLVLADCRFNVEVRNGRVFYSNDQGIFELLPKTAAPATPER